MRAGASILTVVSIAALLLGPGLLVSSPPQGGSLPALVRPATAPPTVPFDPYVGNLSIGTPGGPAGSVTWPTYDPATAEMYVGARSASGNWSGILNYSATTGSPLGAISLGFVPDGIAIDPTSGLLFAVDYTDTISSGCPSGNYPNTFCGNLSVVQTRTGRIVASSLLVGGYPRGAEYDPANGVVYIDNDFGDNVSAFNGSTGRPLGSAVVGPGPASQSYSGVSLGCVDEANGDVYVTNYGEGEVWVLGPSGSDGWGPLGSFNVSRPYSCAFDPALGRLYVAQYQQGISGWNVTVNPSDPPAVGNLTTFPGNDNYLSFDPGDGELYLNPVGSTIVEFDPLAQTSVGQFGFNESEPGGGASAYDPLLGDLWVANLAPDNVTLLAAGVAVRCGPCAAVTFVESGLPAGSSWSVLCGAERLVGSGPTIVVDEPNGSYECTVPSTVGSDGLPYAPPPSQPPPTFSVDGTPVNRTVSFLRAYSVDFEEQGVSAGATWGVEVGGSSYTGTDPSLSVGLVNGSYPYTALAPPGLSAPSGEVVVDGASETVDLPFAPSYEAGYLLNNTLGEYRGELRLPDGRVNISGTIAAILAGGANTYNFLIHDAPTTDYLDLELFLPAAWAAGIRVWVDLVPPTEEGSALLPFGTDYVAWAGWLANLSLVEPNLVAWTIDDFNANTGYLTPTYVSAMTGLARRINPELLFLPTVYNGTQVSGYQSSIDGALLYWSNLSTDAGIAGWIGATYDELGAGRPIVTGIYLTYTSGDPVPPTNALDTSEFWIAHNETSGSMAFTLRTNESDPKFAVVHDAYAHWNAPPDDLVALNVTYAANGSAAAGATVLWQNEDGTGPVYLGTTPEGGAKLLVVPGRYQARVNDGLYGGTIEVNVTGFAAVNVTLEPLAPISIEVEPGALTLGAGEPADLEADPSCPPLSACPGNITYVWSVANPLGSTLNGSGAQAIFLAGPRDGNVSVAVSASRSGFTVRSPPVTITIVTSLSAVDVLGGPGSILPGGAVNLTATPVCLGGPCPADLPIGWTLASGPGALSATQGAVTTYVAGEAPGTAAIFANASLEGVARSSPAVDIEVLAAAGSPLTSVVLTPSTVRVMVNASVNLSAEPLCGALACSRGLALSWSVTGAIGELNSTSGSAVRFLALGPGTEGTIGVAATLGNVTRRAATNVTLLPAPPRLVGVTIDPASLTLPAGEASAAAASLVCSSGPCPSGALYLWWIAPSAARLNSTDGPSVLVTALKVNGTLSVNVTLGAVHAEGFASLIVLEPSQNAPNRTATPSGAIPGWTYVALGGAALAGLLGVAVWSSRRPRAPPPTS